MKEVRFSDGDVTASDIVQNIGADKVTVSGIVINGDELGVIRYIQDGTAG